MYNIGDLSYRIEPTEIDNLENILNVKACIDASAVIVSVSDEFRDVKAGKLMVCGNANNYKLGLGKDISSGVIMSPMPVECDEPVFKIEIGENHSMLVSLNGKLYVSGATSIATGGKNYYNFTHIPINDDEGRPEVIYHAVPGKSHSVILTTSGYVYLCGKSHSICSMNDVMNPTKFDCLPNEQPVKYIHVSEDMTFAITIDGKCWYWGSSANNTIYDPKELNFVKNISLDKLVGTHDFGVGFSPHKIIYSWGKNDYGQLGRGYDGTYDSEAKIVQVIQNNSVYKMGSIDRVSQIELLLVQTMASLNVEWERVFEIVKFEPFRQREVFLYTTELGIIKSLQQILALLLSDTRGELRQLQKKRGGIITNLYGCKSGTIDLLQQVMLILYLQPAYLSRLIFLDSQMTLKIVAILYFDTNDDYTNCLLMALYRLVVSTELRNDFNVPKAIELMKLFNKTDFKYTVPKDFKVTDLLPLVESFPLTPSVEKMLCFTLALFKRHCLSVEIANINLIQVYFALMLESVDNCGQATIGEFKKKRIYDALIKKINAFGQRDLIYKFNLQHRLTNGLFKMHFQPSVIDIEIPCSLVHRLYQVALDNLNRLNMSVHDPLVGILSHGLTHPNPCNGSQYLYIDRRFLISDKNLSFCTYSNVPVPQRLAYRQSSYVDLPPSEDMQQIYNLEDVKSPICVSLPHRMLSPIYRYQQPSRNDPKWLLQQTLRIIKGLDSSADIAGVFKEVVEEYVANKEFLKASLVEETISAISGMSEKQLAKLAVGVLEMQQMRSAHYRYLSLVFESQKELVKEVSYYKDRIDKEILVATKFISSHANNQLHSLENVNACNKRNNKIWSFLKK